MLISFEQSISQSSNKSLVRTQNFKIPFVNFFFFQTWIAIRMSQRRSVVSKSSQSEEKSKPNLMESNNINGDSKNTTHLQSAFGKSDQADRNLTSKHRI